MEESLTEAAEPSLDFSLLFTSSKKPSGATRVPRSTVKAPAAAASELCVGAATPRLVLQQYASTPQIHFGEVAPKACVKRALAVANESGRTQRVEIKALESRDAMRIYPNTGFEVPAHSQKEVTLTWTPGAPGVLNKKLELKWNQSNSVYAELRGTCSRTRATSAAACSRA